MNKWEYCVIESRFKYSYPNDDLALINDYVIDNWELVTVVKCQKGDKRFYFKRIKTVTND